MIKLTIAKRPVLIFQQHSLGGREFKDCTSIEYINENQIKLTYDYIERDNFGCTTYTSIIIDNIEEIIIK